jgi:hypothetical protein
MATTKNGATRVKAAPTTTAYQRWARRVLFVAVCWGICSYLNSINVSSKFGDTGGQLMVRLDSTASPPRCLRNVSNRLFSNMEPSRTILPLSSLPYSRNLLLPTRMLVSKWISRILPNGCSTMPLELWGVCTSSMLLLPSKFPTIR